MAKLWASNIRFGYCAIMTDDVIHSANDGYAINKHGTSISMVSLRCPVLLLKLKYAESEEKEHIF